MTNEQWHRWRKIVARCERWAPVTIGSRLRYETVLVVDEELRQLRRDIRQLRQRVEELEGQGDAGRSYQVRRTT